MSTKTNGINVILAILGFCLSFELGSYYLLTAHGEHFRVREAVLRYSTDQEKAVWTKTFDADLGWLTPFDTRYGQRPGGDEWFSEANSGHGAITLFGDSFTYGDGVADHETISSYLSKEIDSPVLNFGQPGYGTDQAVLYFEQKASILAGSHAVLGLTAENLNRIINSYRPCYSVATRFRFTKPVFQLHEEGLRLIENPVRTIDQLSQYEIGLVSGAVSPKDYWCQNAGGPTRGFPFSIDIVSAKFFNVLRSSSSKAAATSWATKENRDLLAAILDRFRDKARKASVTPILMLLDAVYASDMASSFFGSYCDSNRILCVNVYSCLRQNPTDAGAAVTRLADGHFDANTNKRVAACMEEWIKKGGTLRSFEGSLD
jgi:hypothetical protein